jgi:hypothetical protein
LEKLTSRNADLELNLQHWKLSGWSQLQTTHLKGTKVLESSPSELANVTLLIL